MRHHLRAKMAVLVTLAGVLLAMICALVACSAGSEEVGRIRVTSAQAAGIYRLGSERLELKPDGTYVQDTISESQPLHHTGQWRIVNHFLDGSEVLLLNAVVTPPATPEDNNPRLAFGDLPMYAHNRSGKVALARNEVAEWYYERFQRGDAH
jgi:hypothetical protein